VRVVPAKGFFKGFLETDAGHREVLTEVRVPRLPPRGGCCYLMFKRRSQERAVVGVAAVVDAPDGTIDSASIGLTNMGPTPYEPRKQWVG
jgi:aerobic carbon-monoxide dehydrogenase medium subunit